MSEYGVQDSTISKAKKAEEIVELEAAVNKTSKRKVSLKQVEMEAAMVQDAVNIVGATMDLTQVECEVEF